MQIPGKEFSAGCVRLGGGQAREEAERFPPGRELLWALTLPNAADSHVERASPGRRAPPPPRPRGGATAKCSAFPGPRPRPRASVAQISPPRAVRAPGV